MRCRTVISAAIVALLVAGCGSGDGSGARSRAASRSAASGAGLQPPASPTPAAGACASSRLRGATRTALINPDVPQPRCLKVYPDQRLRLVNHTNAFGQRGRTISVRLARFHARLARGEATVFREPFGRYLAPGDHVVWVSQYGGRGGPEVFLVKRGMVSQRVRSRCPRPNGHEAVDPRKALALRVGALREAARAAIRDAGGGLHRGARAVHPVVASTDSFWLRAVKRLCGPRIARRTVVVGLYFPVPARRYHSASLSQGTVFVSRFGLPHRYRVWFTFH
jgi:hypothetical protein